MGTPQVLVPLVRLFYRQFYNRFAFTYDAVSAVVSRGEWRDWARAAIPFVSSPSSSSGKVTRVLEIAFGTGNLLVDLTDAGYAPVGVDLSPYMIEITRSKLRERGLGLPILQAAVQQLPFPTAHFDSIVMTFPPGFASDAQAMNEIRRVLANDGRLIWVDAPSLYPHSTWSRFLNWAFRATGGASRPRVDDAGNRPNYLNAAEQSNSHIEHLLPHNGWCWHVQRIDRRNGYVYVMVGSKLDTRKI